MVIIRSIHIKNFRSIVDETIDLTKFNLFVGKNDSGKSNVLKALNLFFNGETDFNTDFNFEDDYCKFAKRGRKQAKEIQISIDVEIPSSFKEKGIKEWKKTWRTDGLHYDNLAEIFDGGSKVLVLLRRIAYFYIPAVKSNEYFRYLLSQVYSSMVNTADSSLSELKDTYSDQLKTLTSVLSDQLRNVLHIESVLQMPRDLIVLFRDLSFSTSDQFVSGIDLNHRGDGIKARHIPAILLYMQKKAEKNKIPNSVSKSFIWGFEEPENGVEYLSCFELADELYSYRKDCQLLVTTHSPAIYMKHGEKDVKCYYVSKNDIGASDYETGLNTSEISEKIGFLPLVAPYIQQEREKYLKREEQLNAKLCKLKEQYESITGRIIIITEGKTDVKHIKTAFANLSLDQSVIDGIEYYDYTNSTLGDELKPLLDKLSNIPNTNIIIGVFDRDKHVEPITDGKDYLYLGNNVYRFNIPPLSNEERDETDRICIEHYYSNAEITKNTGRGHLYLAKDFNKYGVSADKKWIIQNYQKNNSITPITIIDSQYKHLQQACDNARIASKDTFADYVAKHPEKFDFSNFKKIYDVIVEIKREASKNKAES
jgi:predicted ATPase